jgi:hypothetical protein
MLLKASKEAFKGLEKSFYRPWKTLLKALEEVFNDLGGDF